MRLLGESVGEATVTIRIGAENDVEGLRSTSLVAAATAAPAIRRSPGSA